MASPLGKSVEFLRDFGLFDVILPFLLVFTVTFAVLEKTRILGSTKIHGTDESIPNKNLNAMVSFVVALLVVATANIVRALNESLPNIVLLLVASLSFLILIGIFVKDELDFAEKHKKWNMAFIIIMFIGVILIFLNAIYMNIAGEEVSVLEYSIDWIIDNWSGTIFGSIVILVIVVVAIGYITSSKQGKKKDGE
ncbi:hypothetical protein J4406_00615 [Candidatus Woesearchaeota archaeon]|nr:hypothetical protein [Candidatus Woesearchaeota archaeon]